MKKLAVGDKVQDLKGVTYEIIKMDTVEDHRAAGRMNVVNMMIGARHAASLCIRRPRGRKCYYAILFESGNVRVITGTL